MAILTRSGVKLTDFSGKPIERADHAHPVGPHPGGKGRLQAFHAQGDLGAAARHSRHHARPLLARFRQGVPGRNGYRRRRTCRFASSINIAACGTSWHAALAGKYMIERLARLPVDVDYASEYRYRNPIPDRNALGLLITQSGETADTLAAQREMIHLGSKTVAICNVVGAMVAREAHGAIYTHAGPEIGVASTKAFTAQLTALFLLALKLGQLRGRLDTRPLRRADGRAQPHSRQRLKKCCDRSLRAMRKAGEGLLQRARFPLSRPRNPFPYRARRRPQAQGNLLYSRRGLPCRRDEARPQRADR